MKYQKTIDEYRFEDDEFLIFENYIETENFRLREEGLGFEFTEADSIIDKNIVDTDVSRVCGRVIYYPLRFGNIGLYIFRGSRLEGVVKEHFGLQDVPDSSASNSLATRV